MSLMKHAKDAASAIIANQSVRTEGVQIQKEINIEKPVGNLIDMNVSVTDQITELYEQKDEFPWTSCSVVNDGSGGVYVVANDWKQPVAPIPPRESLDIDLKARGALKRLYLLCPPGETATVRIYALK